ncbi:MAG: hypothetical protein BGO26_03250 [Actinobacteria bacterium 69-20]|nr:MAG: hypothetical protein BGO26_03250 [Actinobacteria bacterium 69-20]
MALSLAYPLRGYLQQQAAEAQAIAEQHDLEAQIKDLNAQIAALKDPAYIRAEAKRRLQYVTPGDTVYVVKVPGAAGAVARQDSSPAAGSGYDAVPPGAASGAAPTGPSLAASGSTGTPGSTATTGQQPGQQPDGAGPWYSSLWGTLTGGRSSGGGTGSSTGTSGIATSPTGTSTASATSTAGSTAPNGG